MMHVEPIHLKAGGQPDQMAPKEINETLFGHLRPARALER